MLHGINVRKMKKDQKNKKRKKKAGKVVMGMACMDPTRRCLRYISAKQTNNDDATANRPGRREQGSGSGKYRDEKNHGDPQCRSIWADWEMAAFF